MITCTIVECEIGKSTSRQEVEYSLSLKVKQVFESRKNLSFFIEGTENICTHVCMYASLYGDDSF